MVLTVFVWFQTTFDFMTEALLPKEIRIFALALDPERGDSSGAAAALEAIAPRRSNAFRGIIYGCGRALGAAQQRDLFRGGGGCGACYFVSAYVYVFFGALAFLLITGTALRRAHRTWIVRGCA